MKRILLLAMLLPFSVAHGQNLPGTKLKIKKFDGEIVLDGVLNEQAWKEANIADNWYQNFPVYSLPAPFQTEARFIYPDVNSSPTGNRCRCTSV